MRFFPCSVFSMLVGFARNSKDYSSPQASTHTVDVDPAAGFLEANWNAEEIE